MRHEFVYNSMRSSDYGLIVSGEDTWKRPQPDVTRISVPGRNGDLIQLGNRYLNVDISYRCGISKDLKKNFDAFNAALLSDIGYHRLEDTYHPDHYRIGVFDSTLEPDVRERAVHGEVIISFNCKPQLFLKSGETEIEIRSGERIYNPTPYPSHPLLRFSISSAAGAGSISIGERTVSFSNVGSSNLDDTMIDCETQDIYGKSNRDNRNGLFTVSSAELFQLLPGWNVISYSRITGYLHITPRWWTI